MQDIKSIRVFLAVANARSFSQAALTLGITPASATRLVAKLEDDLGQQLLLRTTRQVSLTSAGALVAARYQPIIDELDRATSEVLQISLPDRGRLRINAPMSMGLRLMPQLIDSFKLVYPNVSLDVKLTDTLVDIIEDACDLAIRISRPPQDKSTIWRKICEVPRHPVAAPSLFNRTKLPKEPDDLDSKFCFSYNSKDGPEIWEFQKGAVKRPFRAGTDIISNNGDFLYSLVEAGSGIALLPDFIVNEGMQNKKVIHLLDDWKPEPLWLTLYYPPYEQLPPLVATFSDFFESYLRDVEGLSF